MTTATPLATDGLLVRLLPAHRWVRVLAAWHVVHGVAMAGAAVATTGSQFSSAVRGGMLIGLGGMLVGDVIAVHGLLAGRHRGRMAALAVDYLTFVAALVVLLQVTNIFTGVDALAANFGRGIPFLVIAVVAYAATAVERLRVVARWIAIAAAVALLLAVGLLGGVWFLIKGVLTPQGIVLLAIVAVSLVAAVRTRREDVGNLLGARRRDRRTIDGLLFASPNLLGFAAFFAGPLLFSLWISLNNWDAFGSPEFIALDNYINILSLSFATATDLQRGSDVLSTGYAELARFGSIVIGAKDPLFWKSIFNIVVFAVLAIPLSVIPALFLAMLLNTKIPGMPIFRALFFVPSIAGVVAVALIWRQLFNATVGWVNYLIASAADLWNGLPLGDIDVGQARWLSDDGLALFSLVIVFAWQYVGFNTVLFLAGLQSLDPMLQEAARIDGANPWQRFRHITIPQLAPTTFFVVASTGILALQLFGEAVVLFPTFTPIGAGPQNATLTPVVYLYDQGFRRFAQGYASAVAWVLFLLIFAFTFVQFRGQRAEAEGI